MSTETTSPEELFATLASDFLASGQEIDEYIKKKLSEQRPTDGSKWADNLIDTFAEIDSNHESLRKAKEEGLTRADWLDVKLGEIAEKEASGDKREVAEEITARIYKVLTGHDQEDATKKKLLPLDDDHRGETARIMEDAIRLQTLEAFVTPGAEKKEDN